MLHAETNATRVSLARRSRAGLRAQGDEGAAVESIDYIRKELQRLGRMARLLSKGELAHFIDVAAEVAAEAAVVKVK